MASAALVRYTEIGENRPTAPSGTAWKDLLPAASAHLSARRAAGKEEGSWTMALLW